MHVVNVYSIQKSKNSIKRFTRDKAFADLMRKNGFIVKKQKYEVLG